MPNSFGVAYIMDNRFGGYSVCLITRKGKELFPADTKAEIVKHANMHCDTPVVLFVEGPLPSGVETWAEHVRHAFNVNTGLEEG